MFPSDHLACNFGIVSAGFGAWSNIYQEAKAGECNHGDMSVLNLGGEDERHVPQGAEHYLPMVNANRQKDNAHTVQHVHVCATEVMTLQEMSLSSIAEGWVSSQSETRPLPSEWSI